MSYLRRALVAVPLVLLLGIASARLAGSGYGNPWFALLDKPSWVPPGWAFPVVWTILYVLMGLALALVLNARGAAGRSLAIGLFALQLALNLLWSPLFFALHQVTAAFWLTVAMFVAALATAIVFGRIRAPAGWLLVPYLLWLCLAGALNFSIMRMNPDAANLATDGASTQVQF